MGLFRRDVESRRMSADEMIAAVNDRRRFGTLAPQVSVTVDSAMRLSAVWACIRLLAGVGSTLPLDTYRTIGGTANEVRRPALFDQPSPGVALPTWLYQVWASLLTDGNAYGVATSFGANSYPASVEILDPSLVSWRSDPDTGWVALVDGKPVDRWPNGPLWHVPLFTMPGTPFGLSPVQNARQSIAAGLAAESFGSQFFTAGGTPNAILYSETELSQEQAQGIKAAFTQATTMNREPAVMGAGLRYERIQVSPEEAQFLDTQRFTVEQIARIYGVFPEMIGGATSGSNVTYANREQRAADWLTFGLMPYLIPIEEALSSLVPRPERVKFNVDGLLRADLSTRYNAHGSAIRSGWMSVNEARALEDLAPIANGDEYLWPPYRAFTVESDSDEPPTENLGPT
jgi:HK97 family phage portal protein